MTDIRTALKLENDDLRAEVARLTAGSEAMQEDARNNTATIKAQAEEIRTLKDALLGIKGAFETNVRDCEDWIQYQNVRKALTGDK